MTRGMKKATRKYEHLRLVENDEVASDALLKELFPTNGAKVLKFFKSKKRK